MPSVLLSVLEGLGGVGNAGDGDGDSGGGNSGGTSGSSGGSGSGIVGGGSGDGADSSGDNGPGGGEPQAVRVEGQAGVSRKRGHDQLSVDDDSMSGEWNLLDEPMEDGGVPDGVPAPHADGSSGALAAPARFSFPFRETLAGTSRQRERFVLLRRARYR